MLVRCLPRLSSFLSCLALICSVSFAINAQSLQPDDDGSSNTTSTSPSKNNIKELEKNFFRNILSDQKSIWTAPFHLTSGDARWGIPLMASFAALVATDSHTSGELAENGENESRLRVSRDISQLGAIYTTGSVAIGTYLVGRMTNNARARETGLLASESLINGIIVGETLKAVSQRERPPEDNSSGDFWDGGSSFPSGHALSAWSVATIFAQEYGRHRPAIQVAAYGIASAVSIARYTGRNHFLSDVLVGSAIGYGIGRYVYHQRHDKSLDSDDLTTKTDKPPSRLMPAITPLYSAHLHTYGVGLHWEF